MSYIKTMARPRVFPRSDVPWNREHLVDLRAQPSKRVGVDQARAGAVGRIRAAPVQDRAHVVENRSLVGRELEIRQVGATRFAYAAF